MTVVPAPERWLQSYLLATPSGASDFAPDYVTLVIQTSSLPSLRVAGKAVDPAAFKPIVFTGYSYGSVDVSGVSSPFAVSADTPFELLQSGFGPDSAYLTYGGTNLPVNVTPPPPPATAPPLCHTDSAVVRVDAAQNIPVLANDYAPSGGLALISVSSPTEKGGTASINGDGSVMYVPPNGYTGPDSFNYTAKDSAGGIGSAQVQVTVTSNSGIEPDPTKSPAAGGANPATGPGTAAPAGSGGGGGTLYLYELLLLGALAVKRKLKAQRTAPAIALPR